MMKRIIFLLVLSLLNSIPAAEHPFTLSQNGKARCVIALPEKPSRYDRMAADDLKFYLAKITGGDFRIVSEKDVKGNAIFLGESKAAAKAGISFIVLDRPNPLGRAVEGLIRSEEYASFLSFAPICTQHGLTMGELALYMKKVMGLNLDLTVIPVEDWDGKMLSVAPLAGLIHKRSYIPFFEKGGDVFVDKYIVM